MTGWIGVDLDGTLAHYTSWVHHADIGAPVMPMVARVRKWLAEGKTVKIFTARVSVPDPAMRAEISEAIRLYTLQHCGQALEATCCKDLNMIELWDDRAVQVIPNTGEPVGGLHD
jgi:hypothetical protein